MDVCQTLLRRPRTHGPRRAPGFTLIEVLVAIAVMAVMAVLGWRGLDGMSQAVTQTRQRADAVLALQAGLAQWKADLDAVIELPRTTAMDWDGLSLRLTRRDTASATAALRVVAWTRRPGADTPWLRWQSLPVHTLTDWQTAWLEAQQWARNPSDAQRQREVAVVGLDDWHLFYYRADAWTNPQSSAGSAVAQTPVPDGVRAVLNLAPGQPVSGPLTLDWVRPGLGGGKS